MEAHVAGVGTRGSIEDGSWEHVDTLVVRSDVDPKSVRINLHARDARYIPRPVAKAMDQIQKDTKRCQIEQGWVAHPDSMFRVTYFFAMDNYRADADGPQKRVQDAIFRAIDVDDNRVDEYRVVRLIRDQPALLAVLYQYRKVGGNEKAMRAKKGRSRKNDPGQDEWSFPAVPQFGR